MRNIWISCLRRFTAARIYFSPLQVCSWQPLLTLSLYIESEFSIESDKAYFDKVLNEVKVQQQKKVLQYKTQLLLQYNPVHKNVPVLIYGGKPICESLVILEYIEETWPQTPLLPKDPYQRAMARFWTQIADEKVSFFSFFNFLTMKK